MEIKQALKQLDTLQKKLYAFGAAFTSLHLDASTVAPSDTAQGRGVALGVLAGEEHKLFSDPSVGELLGFLGEHKEELTWLQNRQVEELTRSYKRMTVIPAEEHMAYTMLCNEADDVWHKAKEQDNFAMFLPLLEKMFDFNRRFAAYYNPGMDAYDSLLNEYERGLTTAYLDKFFGAVREKLVPVIKAIAQKPQIDDSCLTQKYPIAQQRVFSDYLMDVLGLDRTHCGIGETEHPFTTNFNNKDVRITTHYYEDNVSFSMYSVIHEGGHATYELHVADELQYTCLAGGASMSIHESQSRFYENIIGRSRPFIEYIFPKMKEIFPEQLKNATAEDVYRAVNKVQPSLVRTEADEMTYCLHIMIRYEIEKKVIAGTLAVKDIPAEWNRLYKEYLGIDVPNDRSGCLQDSHWSGGMIGYFPSYALGSAYGAQMLKNMESQVDVWGSVAKGDLSPITRWLTEKIHKYGSSLTPAQIIENAVGTVDPTVYTDYLTKKYTELYQL